ncbi:MAG TPA: hypothetical protein PK983_08690, partial [Syntrophales bacterium]|nr:hypothetical protein [Syntrophales bacterium]
TSSEVNSISGYPHETARNRFSPHPAHRERARGVLGQKIETPFRSPPSRLHIRDFSKNRRSFVQLGKTT